MGSLENLRLEPMTEKEEVLAIMLSNASFFIRLGLPGCWPPNSRSLKPPKTFVSNTSLQMCPCGHYRQLQWSRNLLSFYHVSGTKWIRSKSFLSILSFEHWFAVSQMDSTFLWPSVTPLNARTEFSLWLLCANKCCLMHRSRVLHGCLIRHTLCNQQ